MTTLECAFCAEPLKRTFVDLGMAPMVSAYLVDDRLTDMEPFFPLHTYVCEKCYLVQLPQAQTPAEIFGDYPYFSSMSRSWLEHARRYADTTAEKFQLTAESKVIEIASNDGYLLQYFKEKGIPILGVEPAANIAKVANGKGIDTVCKFFGKKTAEEVAAEFGKADLIIGNNVLAHVPDLNDFVYGLQSLLNPDGAISVEFPHLLKTIEENQFDQIFHEHFSYLSLVTVQRIFAKYDLEIFDVLEVPTHGGSIRVYAQHSGGSRELQKNVEGLLKRERDAGLEDLGRYKKFSQQAVDTKHKLLSTLIELKQAGKSIVGYGAPGKGCTMLNYCGVRSDFLDYLVDINPEKQQKYIPGVHLPILHPDKIKETKPDIVLILPWNLSAEIMDQLDFIEEWGGKFLVPIPEARIV